MKSRRELKRHRFLADGGNGVRPIAGTATLDRSPSVWPLVNVGVELSPQEKLAALRLLDQYRRWDSLDDKRRCLQCGKILNGTQIRVLGLPPYQLGCATEDCTAIPLDWVRLGAAPLN